MFTEDKNFMFACRNQEIFSISETMKEGIRTRNESFQSFVLLDDQM